MLVITGTLLARADHGGGHIGTAISGHVDRDTCRFARYDGRVGWSPLELRKTIRCAVRRWPVAGGASKAIDVAICESHLNERAVSASGSYAGAYQQAVAYWPTRYHNLRPRHFELKPSPLNGRSNVIVSIRMSHRSGWGSWSCS